MTRSPPGAHLVPSAAGSSQRGPHHPAHIAARNERVVPCPRVDGYLVVIAEDEPSVFGHIEDSAVSGRERAVRPGERRAVNPDDVVLDFTCSPGRPITRSCYQRAMERGEITTTASPRDGELFA